MPKCGTGLENISPPMVLVWQGWMGYTFSETREQGQQNIGSGNTVFACGPKIVPGNPSHPGWEQNFWIFDFFHKMDPYLFGLWLKSGIMGPGHKMHLGEGRV